MGQLHTDFLTGNSSFLTGIASSVNIAGNFYRFNSSDTPAEADRKAVQMDWRIVASDITSAIEKGEPSPECLKK